MVRRILWFLPTLVAVTVVAFGGISWSFHQGDTEALFFNQAPTDIATRTWRAAKVIADAPLDEPSSNGAAELIAIGAAGLPHLLKRLDGLAPGGRYRVADALMPLSERMGLEATPGLHGLAALRYWREFWEQHAVDFEPISVRRLVSRFAQRATPLRERELRRLDTAALPELFRQLEHVQDDPVAVEHLAAMAAHITGQPWTLAADAPAAARTRVVHQWQSWWSRERHGLTDPEGFERLLAPLLNTRYAQWAREAARTRFGTTQRGEPALKAFTSAAPVTLLLFGWALVGGPILGLGVCALSRAAGRKYRLARHIGLLLAGLTAALAIYFLSGASGFSDRSPEARIGAALLLVVGLGAAMANHDLRGAVAQGEHATWMTAYRMLGLSDTRLFWLNVRHTSASLVEAMVRASTTLLSAVVVVECGLHIEGLGLRTIGALLSRDMTWLMLATLASASLGGVVHLLGDSLLALLSRKGPTER